MSAGDWVMNESERDWLRMTLENIRDDIGAVKQQIGSLPCAKHGGEIDVLNARYENGQQLKKSTRNLIAILISAALLGIGVLSLYAAFIKN